MESVYLVLRQVGIRLQQLLMSTSNFQWRHDGLRWRIKLMQNTPAASLFYCREKTDMITAFFREIRGSVG